LKNSGRTRFTFPVPGSETTPGVNRARSLNPRPFNGKSTICEFVMTWPKLPDSEFNNGTSARTSSTVEVSPIDRSTSNCKSLSTCISTPGRDVVRKPAAVTATVYCPGFNASTT